LMHDFQHATSEAVPELFKQLKAGGYKVVLARPVYYCAVAADARSAMFETGS
jgi:hypothetical protein